MSTQVTPDAGAIPLNLSFTVTPVGCSALSQWTQLEFTSSPSPLNGQVTIGGQTVTFSAGSDNNNSLSFQFTYNSVQYSFSGTFKSKIKFFPFLEIKYEIKDGQIMTQSSAGGGIEEVGTWSATAQTGVA